MKLAPIVLFVYNRPELTRKTLESLMANNLSEQSELYIFSDGPKISAGENDLSKVNEVRSIIRVKNWCGQVNITESDINKGLAKSIIDGITLILNDFDKVIVDNTITP